MPIGWRPAGTLLVAPVLGVAALGCGAGIADQEQAPSCQGADLTLEGSMAGEPIDHVLAHERGTAGGLGGAGTALDRHVRMFAHPGGAFLSVRGDRQGLREDGTAAARLLYRAHPEASFVLSADVRLTPADSPFDVGFEASSLGTLPACGTLVEPSGLVVEVCDGECGDAFVVRDADGETTALERGRRSGPTDGPFTVFELRDGTIAVYEVDSSGNLEGFVLFGDRGPDPRALHCVTGVVTASEDRSQVRATFHTMRRAGSVEDATPVAGDLRGTPCGE